MRRIIVGLILLGLGGEVQAQDSSTLVQDANDLIAEVRGQREDAEDKLAKALAMVDKLNRMIKQIDAEQDAEQDGADAK